MPAECCIWYCNQQFFSIGSLARELKSDIKRDPKYCERLQVVSLFDDDIARLELLLDGLATVTMDEGIPGICAPALFVRRA